jgi:Tol biopolymer transport system component
MYAKWITALAALLAVVAIAAASANPAAARPRGLNGKIVTNSDNLVTGEEQVYTVDPDGTDQQLVYNNSEVGQWSPDGTRIVLVTQLGPPQVLLFNVDNGSTVYFGLPDTLYPDLALFCTVWSPDGARLACEGFGPTDESLNGVYTLRSSDGGDLQRVTSAPFGDDCPGDYSSNGKRLVVGHGTLATVKLDGSGLRQITPSGMFIRLCDGSWSPQGNEILFSARVPSTARSTVWAVHSDGSELRQIPIAGCAGSIDCSSPRWSPDGTKFVFTRFDSTAGQSDIYTVNADGTGLFQVTDTPLIAEGTADWGTHPLTP